MHISYTLHVYFFLYTYIYIYILFNSNIQGYIFIYIYITFLIYIYRSTPSITGLLPYIVLSQHKIHTQLCINCMSEQL
jgi:hypothetical protein